MTNKSEMTQFSISHKQAKCININQISFLSKMPYLMNLIVQPFYLYIFVMKLRIRLQNHGCANHPYWWIVVAPHRKNIKGRFIEHLGYWAPREGVNVDRQITLNMPRIKYWMGNGAVPTPKIQKFLSIWDVMPQPWYPRRTPEELAALRKPESEWTDKDKMKQQRKKRRRQRLKLNYINYHRPMAKYKSLQTFYYVRHSNKLRQKIQAAEKENQIIRQLLIHNEFGKINRINELSGKIVMDDSEELLKLQEELSRAKSELALLDKSTKNFSPLQKTKIIKEINGLVDKIREAELKRAPFRQRSTAATTGENITQFQIDRQLEYELVQKKIQKINEELEYIDKLYETVTLEQYANYIQHKDPEIAAEEALAEAKDVFIERGKAGLTPMTKYELYFEEDFEGDPAQILDLENEAEFDTPMKSRTNFERGSQVENVKTQKQLARESSKLYEKQKKDKYESNLYEKERQTLIKLYGIDIQGPDAQTAKVHEQNLLKHLLTRPDVVVPTNRPVHPFPDLETYIPQQYYEPIVDHNLKIVYLDSLEPNDELQKYNKKREYASDKSSKGLKGTISHSKRSQTTV